MTSAKELSDRLLKEFPESRPRLTEFPSGGFMIDVQIYGVPYVAEYEATFGWEGVEQSFSSIEKLADEIFKRLRQEQQ
jgi:hypothetical protein